MRIIWFTILTLIYCAVGVALAQVSADKLAPVFKQQRDMAYDDVARCAVALAEANAKIVELEKKLAEK